MQHTHIDFKVEFTIKKEKIEEYKKLIQSMSRAVEANEPDTITYEFYLNTDETKCIIHETYRNSEAALAHNTGIASQTILPKILTISSISKFDVYGSPSEELVIIRIRFYIYQFVTILFIYIKFSLLVALIPWCCTGISKLEELRNT
jgi:quinol monooxygenase YgiN